MLSPAELREVQLTELEILTEIDRICRKNGIRYCVIAGTLLGAVRHEGFIPWDDDADVALLRPEYERFAEACRTDLDHSRFYFQDHRRTPGYRWGYGKLRRRGTLFQRQHQEHMPYEQGVFVDVFPLDGVPDAWTGRAIENFRCFVLRKFLWSRVGRHADRSRWKRGLYTLMDQVSEKTILKAYEKRIRAAGSDTAWVRILMFPTPNRQYGYLRCWYEEQTEVLFEGKRFPGIRDYDAYLRFKFGDYLQLPPPAERKTHPVSALKLLPERKAAGQR